MTDLIELKTCMFCGSLLPTPIFFARDLLSDSPAAYPVIKCRDCGLIRTVVPERSDTTYYPAGYHRQISLHRGHAFPKTGRSYEERLRSVHKLKTPGRILDVGCGDGSFLMALRIAGWEVCGTEVNAGAVNSLLGQGLDVRNGRLPDLKLPSGYFDVITYFGSFEHVDRPLAELVEVKRLLKDDGYLLINLTNAGSTEARLFGSNWFGFEVPRHCFNYTPSTLHRFLKKAGLTCIGSDIRHNDFITSFSLACSLGLASHYAALQRPLAWLLRPIGGLLRLLGQGNVLEVVAACGEAG
jgi:SAM-dependent methyltransferase